MKPRKDYQRATKSVSRASFAILNQRHNMLANTNYKQNKTKHFYMEGRKKKSTRMFCFIHIHSNIKKKKKILTSASSSLGVL